MTIRTAAYWTSSVLVALACLAGGTAYVLHLEAPRQGMAALGYPGYFVTLVGVWKVLGGLALLAPRLPRLKEWAYAGLAFTFSGAAWTHWAVHDPAGKLIAPLALLGLTVASWALRPPSRRLAGEPI